MTGDAGVEAGADAAVPDAAVPDAGPVDGSAPDDAALDAPMSDGAIPDGGPPEVCEPAAGAELFEVGCDGLMVSVLEQTSGADRVQLHGRIYEGAWGDEACVRPERIEVRRGDEVVQTFALADQETRAGWLAEAEATSELVTLCDDDEVRFEPFFVVIEGRVDGGRFEASCGAHAGGSSWPPRTMLTCHENLPTGPRFGNSMVSEGAFALSELNLTYPDVAGLDLTAVDEQVRILPGVWGGGAGAPLEDFDTAGWEAWIGPPTSPSEWISVDLNAMGDVFGADLCPPASDEPFGDPPPIFLARLTGTNAGQPFVSEGYVDFCSRLPAL